MMQWRPAWAVLKKELRDGRRDRRAKVSALLLPLLGPLLFYSITTHTVDLANDDTPLKVAVVGGEQAPNLVDSLRRAGLDVFPAPDDYEQQVHSGDLDVVLRLPDDFAADFSQGKPARLDVICDDSNSRGKSAVQHLTATLNSYSDFLGTRRLYAHGVSPELSHPLQIVHNDLSTPEERAGSLFGIIPLFLLLTAFLGGMYVATDSTAGERERGSLESLLLNPVSPGSILAGKWAATVIAGSVAIIVSVAGFGFVSEHANLQAAGLRASLGTPQLVTLVGIMVPLVMFTSALQLLISLYARTNREAQTYLQLLTLAPTIPVVMLTMSSVRLATWMQAVPVLGQYQLATSVVRGEPLSFMILVAALGAVAGALVFLFLAARLLGDERTVYGRSS